MTLASSDESEAQTFKIRTLFHWKAGQSDLLSRLVLSLKGKRGRQAWAFYARLFTQKWIGSFAGNQRIFIVPAPARGPLEKDHAFLWAQELAQCLGAEIIPCLKKVSVSRQRGSGRGERALAEMEVLENYTLTEEQTQPILWVFADDIVTTGSTARAAHLALGQPKRFEVWALARRSLACGASRDLL